MSRVKLNLGKIDRAVDQAFKDTCLLLGRTFTEVISQPGAFKGFSGGIVDTGQLRSSQRLEFITDSEAQFSWPTEYALYVHEGYTLRNGSQQPGRPWTTEGLRRFDVDKTFAALLKAGLK
jgi:hypothetical protein